jgi:hypothetical protein
MTVTTAETLAANGIILNTLAKNIESLTGRLRVPKLRTENITVPGRHGTLYTRQKYYDEGEIVLPMWVRGCDDDGLVTTGRAQFMANIDTLTRIFRPGDGLIELVHTLADGSSRRVMCEVTEAIDFSVISGSGNIPVGKFSVALRVPSVFWEDTIVSSVDLPPTQNGEIAALSGMSAPLEDSVWTITGPVTNPRVEALYNGQPQLTPNWFQYSGTIPAGQGMVVDCGKWLLTGVGGFVPNYSFFSHSGGSRWLTLQAAVVGHSPEVKITSSATTSATKFNLTGRRKYLVG